MVSNDPSLVEGSVDEEVPAQLPSLRERSGREVGDFLILRAALLYNARAELSASTCVRLEEPLEQTRTTTVGREEGNETKSKKKSCICY